MLPAREQPIVPLRQRPSTADYYDLGSLQVPCLSCGALHWIDERKSTSPVNFPQFQSCCLNGAVQLPPFRALPLFLYQLLHDQTAVARHFRNHLRAYNSAFAFTSLDCTPTNRGAQGPGVQVFQIHGALYHRSGPLDAPTARPLGYAQLYFHDPKYAAGRRHERNPHLQIDILRSLTEMLHEISNPYISIYRTARERINQAANDASILLTSNLSLALETGIDRRRENVPTSDELGLVIPDAAAAETCRPIVLAARNSTATYKISAAHPSYMPLHYVLMFPHGDRGWSPGLRLCNRDGSREMDKLTQQAYYRFYLHPRPGQTTVPFRFYRLFQQYVVDIWAICDQARLDWARHNQATLRADLYNGVADAVMGSNQPADARIGRRIILPSSHLGSSRFISHCYQDSMAIVRRYGRPTLFITFTASSYWPEVDRELREGETGLNRPDLVCRAFHLKAQKLLRDVKSGQFGTHLGHVYTIEYQKRGLPHIHLLLFLTSDDREGFTDPVIINSNICAEIPTAVDDPDGVLTEVVRAFMLHGPCGEYNPNAPCMITQSHGLPPRCSKNFPKPYCPETVVHQDGYPEYRRRNDGRSLAVICRRRVVHLDNRWVVPYNPQFLRKYWAHINVEVCGTIHAIKYVHKYIYKGTDRAVLSVTDDDEVQQYLNGRYISPSEAVWRLFEYHVHEEKPPVIPLSVHLPNQQMITLSC